MGGAECQHEGGVAEGCHGESPNVKLGSMAKRSLSKASELPQALSLAPPWLRSSTGLPQGM